jgi:hypothetical protein
MAKVICQEHRDAGKAAQSFDGVFAEQSPIVYAGGELWVTLQGDDRVFQVRFSTAEADAIRRHFLETK